MGTLAHYPYADWRNLGWALVGAFNTVSQALASLGDANYIICPGSKSDASVTFPVDIESVPEGAVITSVTLKARIGTGTGSAPAGVSPSLTFSIAAKDDTSKFTVRTVFATGSPTDIEIATYNRDAIGELWDIFRLNNLICRVFSYVGIFDLVRCYRLWCDIKYRVRPVVSVTAPSGTEYTPSPVLGWTYTQADGDPCDRTQLRVFTAAQTTPVSFDPDAAPPVWSGEIDGDVNSVTLPTSLNPDSYKLFVRSWSSFGAKSVWESRQFSIVGQSPGTPGLPDPTGTLPSGTGVVEVVPDSITGSATLRLRDTSNQLSVQNADFEVQADSPGDVLVQNGTATRDAAVGFGDGSASMKVAVTAASGTSSLWSNWVEVPAGMEMTARAQFLADTTGRPCRMLIDWYDSDFTFLSTSTGTDITDATGTWLEASVTATSPAGAANAVVKASFDAAVVGEVHWIDRMGLMYGTDTPWSDGGHTSRNLLSLWYSTADGVQGSQDWDPDVASAYARVTAPGGTGGSGGCNRLTYNGVSPTLGWRAAGTAWNSATSGTDFTLNKPAGVASGDLMLAFVTSSEYAGTINPPAGWSLVNIAKINDGSLDTAMYVLKRTAGGSEPSSWSDGSLGASASRRSAVVVAYSGAADASEQFLAEAQNASSDDTPSFLTVASVNNSDANAWRVSAFAVSDNASGGTLVANKQQPVGVPPITFVGTGTAWGSNSSSSYTINKPSGVVSGDLMVAYFTMCASAVTFNAPSGWTVRYSDYETSNGGPVTLVVLYRVAGSSEPSSWSGSVSGGSKYGRMITQSAAYRNVNATTPFLASGGTSRQNAGYSITSNPLTNTDSAAWRMSAFAALTTDPNGWTTSETKKRTDNYYTYQSGSTSIMMADSNGSVSTGSYTTYGYPSESMYAAVSFIAYLKPLASPPPAGGNETTRATATVGSANPWMTTIVADSNGVIPTGGQAMSGIWSASDRNSMAGWQGVIKPAAAVTGGYTSATMHDAVDVSLVAAGVDQSKVTVMASFFGGTGGGGTPYLTVDFMRANQILSTKIAEGVSFNTTTWSKTVAVFDVPSGTTRMRVTVSASDRSIGDQVYWDRLSLAFGEDPTFRPGTARGAHPIWSIPVIEYADDDGTGYGPWKELPGVTANPPVFEPLTGATVYIDHTVIPLTNRKYRARTQSFGLAGDLFVSDWGPDSSEFSFVAENWWLKDLSDLESNIELRVKWENNSVTTSNTATAFQPIGRDKPVVLTEGYKGDVFTLSLIPVNRENFAQLRKMLRSGKTLFLQSDVDLAWWVRPVGDLQSDVLPTGQRQENPLREIKVTFTEVDPPV